MESRSTWACELKLYDDIVVDEGGCHAPRERVSWNDETQAEHLKYEVTLHVSVWVEINWKII